MQIASLVIRGVTYIVCCCGVVQIGGPDPWYNQGSPAKVVACESFLFPESFQVVKIKYTFFILLLQLIVS